MLLLPALVLSEAAKKALPYLLVTCVIVGLGLAVYHHGYTRGVTEIRLEWEQDKAALRAEYDSLVLKAAQQAARQEEQHRLAQQEIADELAQTRKDHGVATARLRADFGQRLLQSDRRADVYQRQAQAGASAQRDLAGHAARLDRALEEGVGLVGELQAALGLREHQLVLLGRQIRRDRETCQGADHDR